MKKRKRYRTFGGAGCALQLGALVMFAIGIATFLSTGSILVSSIFGGVGLVLGSQGSKRSVFYQCRRCGETVTKEARICPLCSSGARR